MEKEPIAIIGIGCRFPGAENPEAFWQLLCQGGDAITQVPKNRWDLESVKEFELEITEKINPHLGGFLEQVDRFDPQFFGISPREANSIDPQHRLLLEVTWEALEDARVIPEHLSGREIAVYIGICSQNYSTYLWSGPSKDPYATTGTADCMAANRISYWFNWRGPSIAIDTACSSSLVAVHLACQSLWNGESSLALAGGVNVILSPKMTLNMAKAGFIDPDSRCKVFDAGANGFVRSEGAGVVLLKPLSQAKTDGNSIYAVIRGSAVNQDGRSNGITAPNLQAQEAVLRKAYQQAGISPGLVQYVEVQGTGTQLGDSIEMKALGKVMSKDRLPGDDCAVGSVKTNIGHLEAASGIAGLIKVALSLKNQQIPASLHFQEPNPYIPFNKLPLRVQTALVPWPKRSSLALAGVSAFGFGGTNSHVVLEAAPVRVKNQTLKVNDGELLEPPVHLLTLSAKTENALKDLARRYQDCLDAHPELAVKDICFSANTGRSLFNHRLAIIAESRQDLRAQLDVLVAGKDFSGAIAAEVKRRKPPKIAFLFAGEDSEYVNRGRQLYDTQPVFRQTLELCDRLLQPYLEKSLLDVIYPEDSQALNNSAIDQSADTQPALFALEYALFQVWQSWGIKPDIVMGYGIGEYVAAVVAGVFSLEEGLKLIAYRGELMQQLRSQSEMTAVAEGINYHQPQVPIVSNVTGTTAGDRLTTASYWVNTIHQPMSFAQSMETLDRLGYEVFVEIGVQPIWLERGKQYWPQGVGTWLPSLQKDRDNWQQMLQSLSALYLQGVKVDWWGFYQDYCCQKVALPTYPFQRQRYWIERENEGDRPAKPNLSNRENLDPDRQIKSPTLLAKLKNALPSDRPIILNNFLQETIAKILGMTPSEIDIQQPLNTMGLDSFMTLELRDHVLLDLGTDIPIIKLAEGMSIAELSWEVNPLRERKNEAISVREPSSQSIIAYRAVPLISEFQSCIIPLQPEGTELPFFCIHPLVGVAFPYLDLARFLGKNRPFYGLQSPSLTVGQAPLNTIQEMADYYIKAIRTLQPQGPYYLGGWSMGAFIAFEMARQLEQQGETIALLALLDMPPPAKNPLLDLLSYSQFWLTQTLPEIWPYVGDYFAQSNQNPSTADKQWQKKISQVLAKLKTANTTSILSTIKANSFATFYYRPDRYQGKITLLRTVSSLGLDVQDSTLGWSQYSSQEVEVHLVPGRHLNFLRPPHVQKVAQRLKYCFERIEKGTNG